MRRRITSSFHDAPLSVFTSSESSHIPMVRQESPFAHRVSTCGQYSRHSSDGVATFAYFGPTALYPHGRSVRTPLLDRIRACPARMALPRSSEYCLSLVAASASIMSDIELVSLR